MSDFEPFDDELAAALRRRSAGDRPERALDRHRPRRRARSRPRDPAPSRRHRRRIRRWSPSSPAGSCSSTAVPTTRWRRRAIPPTSIDAGARPHDIGGPDTHDRAAVDDDAARRHQPRRRRPSPRPCAPTGATDTAGDRRPHPRPRPPVRPTVTDPAPTTETQTSAGGSITYSWNGSSLDLLSTQPASGHTVEIEDDTSTRIRVRFRGPSESRIEVRVEGGVPVVDID